VFTVKGTPSAVTAALNQLVFLPSAHQIAPGQVETTALTVSATDTIGGTTSNSTTTVLAKAANDAPVISGTVASQISSDASFVAPLSNITISEVDFGQIETVTVTTGLAASGVIRDPKAAADGGIVSGTSYTVKGTAATVTAALNGLIFIPTVHQVPIGQKVTTSFAIAVVDTAGASSIDAISSVMASAASTIIGVTGADRLVGTSGAEVFDGKGAPSASLDVEQGNGGADTFVYNTGYGALEISESNSLAASTAVLAFGTGILPGQISVTGDSSNNLYLTGGVTGDTIKLDSMLTTYGGYNAYGVASVTFVNGTVWTRQQINALAKMGTTGNDTIAGTFASEVFDGRGSNDTITGADGSNTYLYKAGYGNLTILNASSATVPEGQLLLGSGITEHNMWFIQSGSNLQIDILGTSEQISVAGWYGSNASAKLAEIIGGDGLKLDSALPQLVSAMATYAANHSSFVPAGATVMPTDTTLQSAIAAASHS
jgi:hypothetical protein